MHAFMHCHMTEHAQWSRKIIKICNIKIQFYIMAHFHFKFFETMHKITSPNLSSFRLVCIWHHILEHKKNDPSTTQEVTGAYFKWRYLWQNEPILNFIAASKHADSSAFSFNFWSQSRNEGEWGRYSNVTKKSLCFLSLSHSLFLINNIR